jgi:hypothetical protein
MKDFLSVTSIQDVSVDAFHTIINDARYFQLSISLAILIVTLGKDLKIFKSYTNLLVLAMQCMISR